MKRAALLILSGSITVIGVRAQSLVTAGELRVRRLSLADAVSVARVNSFDVCVAQADRDIAGGDLMTSASVFLPRVSISETFVSTNDPLNVFGLKLKQENVTQSDFSPPVLNQPPSYQNFTTKVEVRQPIFNLDGMFGRHAASRAADAADAKLLRTIHGTILAVRTSYFRLVLARQSFVAIVQSLAAASSFRDQARDFSEKGMIQRSDLLMANVRVLELESRKVEAENAIRDAESQLRVQLGSHDTIPIEPTDTLRRLTVTGLSCSIDSLEQERSDMKAIRYGIDAAAAMQHMQQATYFPSLNAFASYELNNDALFGTKGRNWMVGATITWDILKGSDQIGEIQKAAAKRSLLETEYERMKVTGASGIASTLRNLDAAGTIIALSESALSQAEEQLRIVADRYASGLERTADLLQAEATLSGARLGHLHALFQHTTAVFVLEFLLEREVSE